MQARPFPSARIPACVVDIAQQNSSRSVPELRWRERTRSATGAALVELVVVTPLLLLMCLGVADFGRVLYASIVLTNAARAGAAYGAQSNETASDTANIAAAAQAEATNLETMTVTSGAVCECPLPSVTAWACDAPDPCPSSYGAPILYVEVTTQSTFTTLLDWPGIPHTTNLSYTAKYRRQ